MKKLTTATLALLTAFLAFFAGTASAVSAFDPITNAVVFTDFNAAMGTIFAAIIGAGLLLKAGNMVARKLGWR